MEAERYTVEYIQPLSVHEIAEILRQTFEDGQQHLLFNPQNNRFHSADSELRTMARTDLGGFPKDPPPYPNLSHFFINTSN